jgi:hypothetical protein
MEIKKLGCDPFGQPLRTQETTPTKEQKMLARWVNRKAIFKAVKWENYRKDYRSLDGTHAD